MSVSLKRTVPPHWPSLDDLNGGNSRGESQRTICPGRAAKLSRRLDLRLKMPKASLWEAYGLWSIP